MYPNFVADESIVHYYTHLCNTTGYCAFLHGTLCVDKILVKVWSVQNSPASLTYKNECKKEKSPNTIFGLRYLQLGVSTSFTWSTSNVAHCSIVNW